MGVMVRLFGAVVLCAGLAAQPALTQEPRQTLGMARLFTNDTIADRKDRWRTGAYGVSVFRGQGWSGALPVQPFALMEYRFRGEVMAPDNLRRPAPGDRLYAGSFWVGAHTHLEWRGVDVTAGADIVVTGEQTGIRRLQSAIHDRLSMPRMDMERYQVANGVYLHGTVELARSVALGWGDMRPFVEMQIGVETLARAGVDLTFGGLGQGGLRTRDPITGQRIAGIVGTDRGGWSFLVGGDVARVEGSVFLPESRGYRATSTRHRLRAGVNYGFGASNLFYGVTYLSPEFIGQPEGQFVGSLSLVVRY
jgi:hypothetical protein